MAKRNGKVTLEMLQEMRLQIFDILTDISNDCLLKKSEAFSKAKERGAEKLTIEKLNYMIEQSLISPKIIENDGRNTHLFGRDQICTIILVYKLRVEHKLTNTQIATLFREEQNYGGPTPKPVDFTKSEVSLPPQGKRGQYILNSRILAILMNEFMGNQLTPGTIIHLRRRQFSGNIALPKGTAKLNSEIMDLPKADEHVDLLLENDFIAYVSQEPDREILFREKHYKSLSDTKLQHWILISIMFGDPIQVYDLMIGVDDKNLLNQIRLPETNEDINLFGLLMKIAFIKSEINGTKDNTSVVNDFDKSTLLDALVNFITEISDMWEYCAVLTDNPENLSHLRLSAISRDFPKDIRQEIGNIVIEPGQPLVGWAFITHFPIIIQHAIGSKDPRLAYQNLEKATAAIAIPTRVHNHINGVLYVGTRYDNPLDIQVFSDSEVRALSIIADIVGEIIERNRIRKFAEKSSHDVIHTPPLALRNWNNLTSDLSEVIKNNLDTKNNPGPDDNLHITLVRIESIPEIYKKNPVIADWLFIHTINTTRNYFINNGLGDPEIYIQNETSSYMPNNKYVCLLPFINISDEKDREMRRNLRDTLSSIKLPFSFDDQTLINVNLWSMPFRYEGLKNRLSKFENKVEGFERISKDLFSEIDDAIAIIPNIENGHKFEANGAFPDALSQYLSAYYIARNNKYIQRHVAKTYTAIGNLEESEKWWNKILETENHPNDLIRYSNVLARLGKIDQAIIFFQKAAVLDDKNSKILIEWGDLLAIEGQTKTAIQKYEDAVKLENSDHDLLWLRLAEAYLSLDDTNSAMTFTKLVLDRRPDHSEAKRLMLTIQKRMRR